MGLQMCFAKNLSKNMDIQVRTTNSFILFNIITKFLRLFAPCRDITQYCKKIPKNSENFEKFRNFVAILNNIATKFIAILPAHPREDPAPTKSQ